jgi:hypothetical protein
LLQQLKTAGSGQQQHVLCLLLPQHDSSQFLNRQAVAINFSIFAKLISNLGSLT